MDAVRSIPGRRFDWQAKEWWAPRADATAAYVQGVIERFPELEVAPEVEEWLARAVKGWVGRVTAARRGGAGWFVLDGIAGELPEELAAVAERARRPALAAVHAGGRRDAARAAGRAAGPARAALRDAAAGRPRARAGDADAGRELRRAALQARGQLGPGHRRRVRRAARRRGARPHAADRPVPARAARALHPPARDRRRRRTPARRSPGCAIEHDAAIGAVRRSRAADGDAAGVRAAPGRRAAAVPARRRRVRAASRGGCSSPTSRASARPSRRSRRSRRTTPTRRS